MFEIKNKKDIIGVVLFIIAILSIISMLILPTNTFLTNIDEYFTLSLIKLPLMDGLKLTIEDVHPPLYYIILKGAIKGLNVLGISYSTIVVSKIVSIIPYIILTLISATKIRKEYGYLSGGLVAFSLIGMSTLFSQYLTIRMYSWGLLFLILAFMEVKEILKESKYKNWILLSVFGVLGAYTHYFVAISTIIIYCLLLIYILFNNRILNENSHSFYKINDNKYSFNKINENKYGFKRANELKKWGLSALIGVILYSPWVMMLLEQMRRVHEGYWISKPNLEDVFNYLAFAITNIDSTLIKLIAIIFLVIIIIIALKMYSENKNKDNIFILMGIGVFLLSILLGLVLSLLFKPILIAKYLIPSIGVLWISFSILIGKIENNKILIALITVILVFGVVGIADNINANQKNYNHQIDVLNEFNKINNKDTVIIASNPIVIINFNEYLNNTKMYLINDHSRDLDSILNKYKNYKETDNEKVKSLISNNKNKNKNIYFINTTVDKSVLEDKQKINKIAKISPGINLYSIE